MEKTCDALVISCIDFRLQTAIQNWASQYVGVDKYDSAKLAGGIKEEFEVLKQLQISVDLHKIKKVVAINHEDCGAYGATGTKSQHHQDLLDFKTKVLKLYPELVVELYYLHLNGEFEAVK